MRVLGIDPSASKTGLVLLNGKTVEHSLIVTPKAMKGMARVQLIADLFATFLDQWKPTTAAIEGYGYASPSLSISVEVQAFLRMALHVRVVPWYIVPPSTLKKYATGAGGAEKDKVSRIVKTRWGFEAPSDDVVDAYVLAKIGEDIASNNGVPGPHLQGVSRG